MSYVHTLRTSALALALSSGTALAGSGDAFECKGTESNNLYSLEIVDVGDEEGLVVVNNGGAPQTFEAQYDEGPRGEHSFVFGFELYNEGIVPTLSNIELKKKGSKWLGSAQYFEHDASAQSHQLNAETLVCRKVK